jgi:ribosomal protein S18 acetylase RimI-like enzyme
MNPREPVILEAHLDRPEHQRAVVAMTAAYALDVMGNGGPLPRDVLERLVPGLRAHPTSLVFLAYVGDEAVGIATCFLGFSTFAARPLVNVHDLAVLPEYRGRGIGRALLRAVERVARERGCAKLTLEVQENNRKARRVYETAGFAQAVYGEKTGGSLFYWKSLGSEAAAQAGIAADGTSPGS